MLFFPAQSTKTVHAQRQTCEWRPVNRRGKWHVHLNIFMHRQSGWENRQALYQCVNNHTKKRIRSAGEPMNQTAKDHVTWSQLSTTTAFIADPHLGVTCWHIPPCQRQAQGSWKAPHTPFERSWTPLTPSRTVGRGTCERGGGAISMKAIMMSSLLRVKVLL